MENKYSDISLAVIGLGYVGLPLYVELAKKFKTLGYDINQQRINDLESFKDLSGEVGEEELKLLSQQKKLDISCNSESLRAVDVYIITVPTPVDEDNIPDLNDNVTHGIINTYTNITTTYTYVHTTIESRWEREMRNWYNYFFCGPIKQTRQTCKHYNFKYPSPIKTYSRKKLSGARFMDMTHDQRPIAA